MASSPPSQCGSGNAIATPSSDMSTPAIAHATIPCRSTLRAPEKSLAPRRCAACTEKPIVNIEHTPQNSHRLLFIRPTEADSSAPRRPTIEASIYCIRIVDSWAIIAGADSLAVSAICWRRLMSAPSCISLIDVICGSSRRHDQRAKVSPYARLHLLSKTACLKRLSTNEAL